MLLVFIFLAILSGIIYGIIFAIILLLLLLIGILLSRITLDGYICINNINIHNIQTEKNKIDRENDNSNNKNDSNCNNNVIEYSSLINVYLFKFLNIGFLGNLFKITIEINSKFLKIFDFKIDIRKVYLKILENIDLSRIVEIEKDIRIVKAKDIALLNLTFEKIKIYGSVGFCNDFITMHILTFINILLSIIFGNLSFEKETNKFNFKFDFDFLNQDKFYLKINPIFSSAREAIEYVEYLNKINNTNGTNSGDNTNHINNMQRQNIDNEKCNNKTAWKNINKFIYGKINLESKISVNTIDIIRFLLKIRKINKNTGIEN